MAFSSFSKQIGQWLEVSLVNTSVSVGHEPVSYSGSCIYLQIRWVSCWRYLVVLFTNTYVWRWSTVESISFCMSAFVKSEWFEWRVRQTSFAQKRVTPSRPSKLQFPTSNSFPSFHITLLYKNNFKNSSSRISKDNIKIEISTYWAVKELHNGLLFIF